MSAKEDAIKRYFKTDLEFGWIIEDMILKGYHIVPILKKTGLKLTYFRNFIRWKSQSLTDLLSNNSKKINKENAIKHSLLGSEKTRGKELKKIPKEVEDLFINLKNNGICKEHIIKELKKYGFAEKKVSQLIKKFGEPEKFSFSGKNNPMFGKTTKGGVGVKGWIKIDQKNLFCRSSLEMKIFFYLIDNNIDFILSNHKVPYFLDGKERNYFPDINIGDIVCEIKPSNLIHLPFNEIKFQALKTYCEHFKLKCQYITELSYDLSKYNKEYFNEKIKKNILLIDEKNKEKLMRYL